jgi:hypothetical protein
VGPVANAPAGSRKVSSAASSSSCVAREGQAGGYIYIYLDIYIYIFHIIVVSFHFFKKQWILRFVYCSFTNLNPEWLTLFQLKVYMIAVVEPDHVVLYLIKANTNLNKETNN